MKKNKKNLLKKLLEIYEGCKVKKPSKKRDLSNRFVVWNILIKYITFLPAYFFNRLKISPDLITFISFLFVPLGSYFIISEKIILGASCWVLFGALDSLDGDMVRLSKRKTFYGETLDSLGADIFYFLTPRLLTVLNHSRSRELELVPTLSNLYDNTHIPCRSRSHSTFLKESSMALARYSHLACDKPASEMRPSLVM